MKRIGAANNCLDNYRRDSYFDYHVRSNKSSRKGQGSQIRLR